MAAGQALLQAYDGAVHVPGEQSQPLQPCCIIRLCLEQRAGAGDEIRQLHVQPETGVQRQPALNGKQAAVMQLDRLLHTAGKHVVGNALGRGQRGSVDARELGCCLPLVGQRGCRPFV